MGSINATYCQHLRLSSGVLMLMQSTRNNNNRTEPEPELQQQFLLRYYAPIVPNGGVERGR